MKTIAGLMVCLALLLIGLYAMWLIYDEVKEPLYFTVQAFALVLAAVLVATGCIGARIVLGRIAGKLLHRRTACKVSELTSDFSSRKEAKRLGKMGKIPEDAKVGEETMEQLLEGG